MQNEEEAREWLTKAHQSYEVAIAAITMAEEETRKAITLLMMGGDGSKAVTVYGQREPPWGDDALGRGLRTMAQDGCLVTAMASVLTDAGRRITPGELNVWLKENGGFAGANRFVFASTDQLGVIKYRTLGDCAETPAPMLMLDATVTQGHFVVVMLKVSNTVPTHYLRYLGAGQVMDPYYADVSPIVPRYRGVSAAQSILRYVIYDRVRS